MMTVVLWVVAVASILAAAYYATRLIRASAQNATEHVAAFFEERMRAQDELEEGRRVALYKQQKASQTEIKKMQIAVEVLANESRALHENTRLTHQRTDALARDAKQHFGRG
jgi:hypothetical protein